MSNSRITIPTITVAATESLRVVELPSDLSEEETTAALAGLVSSLNRPFVSQKAVVEMVYNLLCFGVPEMRQVGTNLTTMRVVQVTPTKEEFLAWSGVAEDPDQPVNSALPPLPGPVQQAALGVSDKRAVWLALSSLLYCVGKQASESAKASVLDNRPDALIRRFQLPEADQVLLPGKTAGPRREVLESIYNSFSTYTELRALVVSPFLGLRKAGAHLPLHLEIMMTNFNLLRGAGMTHMEAVIKMVRMHPWVMRVPELEPYFHHFAQELEKWEELDLHVREYHRLLVPQSDYMFLSSEYRPLVAVAGSFIEEVEKTFAGYVYNRQAYQDLIDRVHSYAPGYKSTGGLSHLASLLGVADEPLPERTVGAPKKASEVV